VKSFSGLVDVLVPTYQHEPYIQECIDSIFAQDYGNFLVHVFDDCSTDGTGHKLEQLQAKWGPRLKVYRNLERQGSGSSSILYQSTKLGGEFWALLEGDDFWVKSDKLSKQVETLNRYKRTVAVGTDWLVLNEVDGVTFRDGPMARHFNFYDLILNSQHKTHFTHISTILWRSHFPPNPVPWPPRILLNQIPRGDVSLVFETLLQTGLDIRVLDEVTSVYRFSGKGIWSNLSKEERAQENEDLNNRLTMSIPLSMRARIALYKTIGHLSIHRLLGFGPIENRDLDSTPDER
jgi:glycosyltransferase involved in cell wall biosynthesis